MMMVFKVDIPLLLIVLYVSMSSARSLKDGERYTRGAEDAGRNLVDFYQASMPAVMGMLSYNETLQVLQKHFFTDKKEDSIWPKALEETKTWFGEDHKIGELDAIEVDLKKYQHILTRCTAENKGKELTRCLATLKDSLIAGSGNVEWSREQEIPKQLNLFVSFHLMELALLQMLKIQYEKDPISGIDIDRSIKDAAKNFKEVLESSMGTCCEQRTQRIGSLDVCKVTDVLWQEFILECEERIRKRSVSDEDEGSTEDEEEPADTRSNYSFTKDDQGKIKESNIGGKQNDFIESVRARVKDRVTGQYIFNKRLSTSTNVNKANLLMKLQDEGLEVRNKHIKAVEKACNTYWKERGKPIAKQLASLIDFPKKKAQKKKSNKQHKDDKEE